MNFEIKTEKLANLKLSTDIILKDSIQNVSEKIDLIENDLQFTKQMTKNITKFRLLANKNPILAGTMSDTLVQYQALTSEVGMYSDSYLYETNMITLQNNSGRPFIYRCKKNLSSVQLLSNTEYWEDITNNIYSLSSDGKYYYKYQNDIPVQTQHFITIFSSQPLTAQNIKIDYGDGTIIDLYQKTISDLSEMLETSKNNVLNSSKKTAIYIEEPPIENGMTDDFEVKIHIKHNYLESMSADMQAFDMTIEGNSYWGLRSEDNNTNPKNLIDRIWAIGYPFMDGILNTSNLLINNKRIIQVQLPAYSTFITTLYNISSMFKNCTNLIAINGFAKRTWFQQLRAITSLFEGCSSLINSDIMIPRMMSHADVMSSMYNGCKNLCRKVDKFFMPNGFIDKKVNLTRIFSNCKSLPPNSNFTFLRDIIWNDNTKKWTLNNTFSGTSNVFKNALSNEVEANHSPDIPMSTLSVMWK